MMYRRIGLMYRSIFIDQPLDTLPCSDAALSPRLATYFSLLRQRNLRKRKATLVSASPSLRCGATCGAHFKRGHAQTRLRLKQVRALIRLKLRSSAQTQGLGGQNSESSQSNQRQSRPERACAASVSIRVERPARPLSIHGLVHEDAEDSESRIPPQREGLQRRRSQATSR